MYIAYSWPKVLSTPGAHGQYISVHLDQTYFVAVSQWSVQVWSGGQTRLRLGQHTLTDEEAQQYGQHVSACWSTERSCLAALVSFFNRKFRVSNHHDVATARLRQNTLLLVTDWQPTWNSDSELKCCNCLLVV